MSLSRRQQRIQAANAQIPRDERCLVVAMYESANAFSRVRRVAKVVRRADVLDTCKKLAKSGKCFSIYAGENATIYGPTSDSWTWKRNAQ